DVKATGWPEEDLGKEIWHVGWPQPFGCLGHRRLIEHTLEGIFVKNRSWVDLADSSRDSGVKNAAGGVRGLTCLRKEASALLDLCLVRLTRIRDVDEQRLGRCEIVEDDVIKERGGSGLPSGLQRVQCLVDGPDAGEAVRIDETVIEVAHWQTW